MARAPHFFAKPTPSRVEGVEYEPLPVGGEPVYTTHPAFVYDDGLKVALEAYHLQLALALCQIRIKDPARPLDKALPKARAWLAGKIPIPTQHWEGLKSTRQKWLREYGLPPNTPIGKVSTPPHPDLQERFSQ